MSSTNGGLKIPEGKVAMVTTDDWFYHSDGQQYHGIAGKPRVVGPEELVGFQPKGSTDWMLKFESFQTGEQVYVAGCKVHYLSIVNDDMVVPKDFLDMRPWKPATK